MTAASRRPPVGRPVALLLVGTLTPALLCTLLTWWALPDWWQLSGFFWYSILGNSFIPFPHEPAVIYAGAVYDPALVALVGGLGTALASTIDHVVVTRAFRLETMAPIKETRVMKFAVRLFERRPWSTIVLFAFTPLPFYPIRLVAPAANYPMVGYVSAVVSGRIPRYFLLAMGGVGARHLTQSFMPW